MAVLGQAVGHGWPWLAAADHVQPWPTVAGHGRPWAAIAACCLRLAMAKQRRLGPPMLAMASRCCLLWPAIAGQLDAVWETRAAWWDFLGSQWLAASEGRGLRQMLSRN